MGKRLVSTMLLSAVLCIMSCDQGTSTDMSGESQIHHLYGAWQWTKMQGGIGGITQTPQSTGYTRRAVFKSDGVAEFFKNDTLVNRIHFSIMQQSSSSGKYNLLHFADNGIYPDQRIDMLQNDSLVLSDNMIDGFYSFYVRIK